MPSSRTNSPVLAVPRAAGRLIKGTAMRAGRTVLAVGRRITGR